MFMLSTSAGDSSAEAPLASMPTVRRTTSGPSCCPLPASASSSLNTRSANATSAALPVSVTSLPRTCTSAARCSSMAMRFSSAEPSRLSAIAAGMGNRDCAGDDGAGTPYAVSATWRLACLLLLHDELNWWHRCERILRAPRSSVNGRAAEQPQLLATQDVRMHVEHGLAGVVSGVEHNSVTGVVD